MLTPLRTAIPQMPSIGVSRDLRLVVKTPMQELASKDSQTASLHLHRHKVLLSIVDLMVDFLAWHFIHYLGSVVEFAFVAARESPKAAVLFGCILERQPKTEQTVRFSVEMSGILVYFDSVSYFWRLKHCHRLNNDGIQSACQLANFPGTSTMGDIAKELAVLMQSMSDFVDSLLLRHQQLPILQSLRLEEESHFVRRLKKILTKSVSGVVVCAAENSGGLGARLEAVHKLVELSDRIVAGLM